MKTSISLIGLLLVLCVVLTAGCLGGNNDSANNTTDDNNSLFFLNAPEPIDAPADTAMYRGNVTNISVADDTIIITLEQVKGTNFGAPKMNFAITESSRTNFDVDDFADDLIGRYVEVYYGPAADGTVADPATVIVANLRPDASATVYNGEIINVTPETDISGAISRGETVYIEVEIGENDTMVFICNADTKFYMNMADVTVGTQVNILGHYIVALSFPPQNTAFEFRLYSSAE